MALSHNVFFVWLFVFFNHVMARLMYDRRGRGAHRERKSARTREEGDVICYIVSLKFFLASSALLMDEIGGGDDWMDGWME
jgi:hypothetical protein